MRIAYLIASFPALSETFISREIVNLRSLGLDIHVFAFSQPDTNGNDDLQVLSEKVHYIGRTEASIALLRYVIRPPSEVAFLNHQLQKQSTRPANPYLRLGRAYAVAKKAQQFGIDHIHAHWPYASIVAALVNKIIGIPYSISIHAHEVAHENGHFPLIFESLKFAVFCNRAAMEYLLRELPQLCRAKSNLVYHGVDTKTFAPTPLPAPFSPLQIISAGRLTHTKGFERLIAGCIKAQHMGIEVELTILGSGGRYDSLKHEARGLRLKIPGWVPHSQVRDYLAQAHLFALLADDTYHDGLPNVVLEAMACGRPVILSPIPAAPEIVEDGREGFILGAPDDIDGFVDLLRLCAERPDRLVAMGQAARERVVAEHSEVDHIQRLAALFGQR